MFPAARRSHLTSTSVDADLLLYDHTAQTIHTLSPLAAHLWHHADGNTSLPDLAVSARSEIDPGITNDEIDLALADLQAANLLTGYEQAQHGTSRRRLLRTLAAAGIAPAVVSVTAPLAAQAQSARCTPGTYDTLELCEAAIPEREAQIPPECTIITPFYCIYIRLYDCYGITGSFTCPNG